jgi:hypothetical protein
MLSFILLSCSLIPDNHSKNDQNDKTKKIKNRPINIMRQDFANPPLSFKSSPLWFWNTTLNKSQTRKVLVDSRNAGYYGLGILPSEGMNPAFMTPEYLDQYKAAVEMADSLGMKLYLYDEFYFPSGMAGGLLVKQYPEAVSKRLDMDLFETKGSQSFDHPVNSGTFMGAVGMETNSLKRIDLSDKLSNGYLKGELPSGDWKVMIFTLKPDSSSGRNHVDYLSPEAVQRFIELTYEKYYKAFPDHFGTTIEYAFYDEPTLRWVEGGRTWTEEFNNKFKKHYGFSPVIYYPAMWFDIGPETQYARNLLFGFRADLYSKGFPKTINDWCNAHNIKLTGHVDQEEIVNPVALCGDLMKAFKYQDIPAVDEIFYYGRSSKIYKVISSAANNYDRSVVATECYGATRKMTIENLYKEAMDQFAKGINLMEPHAVWYTEKVDIQPDLSPTSIKFGSSLPEYNKYIGRLQSMLQGGQHVADIGVLYPIASLQGSYHFGPGDPGMGGVIPSEADYLDIGEMLALEIRKDFTFIHPEILDEKCRITGNKIQLMNKVDKEEFKTVIIPGSQMIQLTNLQKIKEFYDQGGIVIATSLLPDRSAEQGKDEEVRQIIKYIFGNNAYDNKDLQRITSSSNWNTGGSLPSYAFDGKMETSWKPSEGNLKNEWIQIDLGGSKTINQVNVKKNDDKPFSFTILYFNGNNWIEAGKCSGEGKEKKIGMPSVPLSAIRIVLDSGAVGKVVIPEVEILDQENHNICTPVKPFTLTTNNKGGKAYFVPAPNSSILKTILDQSGISWDVNFENEYPVSEGNLTYIHKKLNGKNIYFFANSSEKNVDIPVLLKGKLNLQLWNPHTGNISGCECKTETRAGTIFTSIQLKLNPVESVFYVSE